MIGLLKVTKCIVDLAISSIFFWKGIDFLLFGSYFVELNKTFKVQRISNSAMILSVTKDDFVASGFQLP